MYTVYRSNDKAKFDSELMAYQLEQSKLLHERVKEEHEELNKNYEALIGEHRHMTKSFKSANQDLDTLKVKCNDEIMRLENLYHTNITTINHMTIDLDRERDKNLQQAETLLKNQLALSNLTNQIGSLECDVKTARGEVEQLENMVKDLTAENDQFKRTQDNVARKVKQQTA